MNDRTDLDARIADWLRAGASPRAPDRVLTMTLDRVSGVGQERPLGGRHLDEWVGRQSPDSLRALDRRWSTALVLLVTIAALVAGAILVGGRLLQPSPHPRLGHLAYGLDGDVFVADWDGSNPVRIADGAPSDSPTDGQSFWGEGPIWAPDGRHLAYRSGGGLDGCCGSVFLADPAGHVVASFPGTGWQVSWSPDSTRVATTVELGKTYGIYGLDGRRRALLALPAGYQVQGDYDPSWSPDGTSLLLPIAPVTPFRPSEVWELPIDGGTPQRVPADDPRSHRAMYSPDGHRVAYTVVDTTTETLVVAAADNSQARPLISKVLPEWLESPRWSPTGDRIAFIWRSNVWQDQAGNPMPGTSELRVVDVASGTVTSLITAPAVYSLDVIAFSPEGDRILFSRVDNNVTSLWDVRADGSDARRRVTGTSWGDWQLLPAGS